MKSVLFATDFVRKDDGTLTPVELNTDINHSIRFNQFPLNKDSFILNLDEFMNHKELNEFMIQNDLNKIMTIDRYSNFYDIFKSFCEFYGYEFDTIELNVNYTEIPDIEEDPNTLIIRISYDNYSIFDVLYARDMYEFHNLIKNETFASPVTFVGTDELDTIDELQPSIDGVLPNYVLKPRYPSYNKQEYPKIYRLESEDKLNSVKSNLTSNEFLQKYEINKQQAIENGNSVYFYRSIDLLISNNFDVINVMSYKSFNSVRIDNEYIKYEYEIDDDHKMNDAMALKYYPLWYVRSGFSYHYDETDKILASDSSLVDANDIKVGDSLSTIKFNKKLNYSNNIDIENLNDFEIEDKNVSEISENTNKNLFINLKVYNENYGTLEWYDGWTTPYLISKKNSTITEFSYSYIGSIEIDDIIYIYDKSKNVIVPFNVTDVSFDIKNIKTYTLSLKNSLFFVNVDSENTNSLFLIQHNADCQDFCNYRNACVPGLVPCDGCGKNSSGCRNCGGNMTTYCYYTSWTLGYSSWSTYNACMYNSTSNAYVNFVINPYDTYAPSIGQYAGIEGYFIGTSSNLNTSAAAGYWSDGKDVVYWDGSNGMYYQTSC